MATTLPPSPFPITSFQLDQEGETTPANFLAFLQTLLSKGLGSSRIPVSSKEDWTTLVEGLSEHFLATFPNTGSTLWSTLHEKIKLCSESLVVIERAAIRVDELFVDSDGRSIVILGRLLGFLLTLESWTTPAVSQCNKVDSPGELRKKAIEAVGAAVGAFTSKSQGESAICEKLLERSLATINEMLNVYSAAGWPLRLSFLDFSSLTEASDNDLDLKLEIETTYHFSLVMMDLFRVTVICFKANLPNPDFISRFNREVALVARRSLNFLLSSDTPLLVSQRVDGLASIVQSVNSLRFPNDVGRNILASVPTTLLVFRLKDGPKEDWRSVDKALHDLYSSGTFPLEPRNLSSLVLEMALRKEWGIDGLILIVSDCSFHQRYSFNGLFRILHALLS
ncbi:hypothetical protein DFH11DRAFT_671972 [Phellopilus nigrolimitatus]|nr:hypothetical protein DFH11DRAFT_671972 [Phellopilus nigrolimitatus]